MPRPSRLATIPVSRDRASSVAPSAALPLLPRHLGLLLGPGRVLTRLVRVLIRQRLIVSRAIRAFWSAICAFCSAVAALAVACSAA